MSHLSKQIAKIWLSCSKTNLSISHSLPYIRYSLTTLLKNLLQWSDNSVTEYTSISQEPLPDIQDFFQSIQSNYQIYKASVTRQISADLPPDVEETTFKNETKIWFLKTADYGDNEDRMLQYPDGRFTQLLEDIARYHQIFQQGYDKIILIRPTTYTGYDIQLTAAMQCLGYTKEQFQFIIVQPIELYAFHTPTQQIHRIPDIASDELIQAIGIDALRWHCLRVPLTSVAPINISTAGQNTPEDSFYRVRSAYYRCCMLLQQAGEQGTIQLETSGGRGGIAPTKIAPAPMPLAEYTWDNSYAEKLASLLQAVPEILQQSAAENAPYLLIRHLEAIGDTCHQWINSLSLTPQACILLLATQQTLCDLLENVLSIQTPEFYQRQVKECDK
jgi:arginyl-tRNA synthetase